MTSRWWTAAAIATTALVTLGGPAGAECLGSGCYDGLGLLIGSAIVCLLLVLVLAGLLILRRWRAAKILGAGLAVVAIVTVLMLD